MGNDLLLQLLSTIQQAYWYAIIADETASIANHEHHFVSARLAKHTI